jgi:DNA-damage-inducible protein J
MPATATVHIRVDEKVKKRATKALDAMGLSLSDAVRLLLVRVAAEKVLPFDIKVPNRETRAAMEAAERGELFRANTVEAMLADLNADD